MPQDNVNTSPNHQAGADRPANGFNPRYLAAKKSVDDRSLNRRVWETLRRALGRIAGRDPIRVLEVGAGIGTMLERVVERGVLTGPVTYVASDSDPGQLGAARDYLSQWARKRGHSLAWTGENRGRLNAADADVSVVLVTASAEELAERTDAPGPFHLLIAHAVLDLVDFPVLLPRLLRRLEENGLACLTCNFDGETVFLPECGEEQAIIRRYHDAMEARLTGASHTGRRLLSFLQRPGLELLAAGSSDWVVHPRNAGYTRDESFFLHAIIDTVERELAPASDAPPGLAAWARLRHRQVESGELSFLARHLDFLVRRVGPVS